MHLIKMARSVSYVRVGRKSSLSLLCIGALSPSVPESTLIKREEECCNGRPVGPNEMCCSDVTSVPLASPTHDSCCLQADTLRGVTYDSSRQYCDRNTGRVRRLRPFPRLRHLSSSSSSLPRLLPRLPSFLSRSSFSKSSQRVSSTASLLLLDGSSAESSSLSSRFDGGCQAGGDDSGPAGGRARGREVGEAARCCGSVSYVASRQTCCRSILHDLPSHRTQ